MPVYVDRARNKLGRMLMCHMLADSTEELLAMADKIGVARRHIQGSRKGIPHFDICQDKRRLAVKNGAISVDRHGLMDVMTRWRLNCARYQPLDG